MSKQDNFPSKVIEPLAKHHDRKSFSCGKPPIDQYLHDRVSQDIRQLGGTAFILVPGAGDSTVLGFYTVSNYGIQLTDLPEDIQKKLPRYPLISSTLIGWLARDSKYDHQGLGEYLLIDALQRSLRLSKEMASFAVILDAIDDEAISFYSRYGFEQLEVRPNRMYLPMKTIERTFA